MRQMRPFRALCTTRSTGNYQSQASWLLLCLPHNLGCRSHTRTGVPFKSLKSCAASTLQLGLVLTVSLTDSDKINRKTNFQLPWSLHVGVLRYS